MNRMIKIIVILIIILAICVLWIYKKRINRESQLQKNTNNEIIEVNIIDKKNNMQKICKEPQKEEYVIVDMTIDNLYYQNVGIRTKGSSIYGYLKANNLENYSFKVKLDYINPNQTYKGITEIYLNTRVYDSTSMREYLAYRIYNEMGIDTQTYFLADLKINGEENGIITIVEVINQKYVAKKYKNNKGNLYKPIPIEGKGNYGADLRYYDSKMENYKGIFNNIKTTNTNDNDKNRLIEIIKKIEKAKTNEEIEKNFIDFNKIIKMIAINKAIANIDNFTSKTLRNYYLYEIDNKIDIIPFDFDLTMGTNPNKLYWTENFDTYKLSDDGEIYSKLVEIIINNSEYIERYKQYYFETLNTIQSMNIEQAIDDIDSKIDEKVKLNVNKIYSYNEYKKGIIDLKAFYEELNKKYLQEKE